MAELSGPLAPPEARAQRNPKAAVRKMGAAIAHFVDPVLFSYSQVFFTRSRAVGLMLLVATFSNPRAALSGLAAMLLALGVVRVARFSPEQAAAGVYGYNPLLVGLALGAFLEPGPGALVLFGVSIVAVVFLQTALESALGFHFNLPVLSLPFVLVTYLALAAAASLEGVELAPAAAWAADGTWLPEPIAFYLRSLGAIFFSPKVAAGALVFAALLVFSRIGVVLSIIGFAAGWLLAGRLASASPVAPLTVAFNGVLTAVALGGIWFVPRRSSFLLAGAGALLSSLMAAALFVLLIPVRLPVLILPFNLAVLAVLYAMRQRVSDGAPKAVDFAAGSPEANLNYFRTRVARLGEGLGVRFALPFSGRWSVTQGVDGEHTHRGPWRHALDFEVLDRGGNKHAGSGSALKDYYCYRLPVLAPADGTVVRVVDGVPDNPVGQRNPADRWGNLVVVQHGIGLFSLVCHLSPGTLEVREGQFVRQGVRLGLCGNSGRSFVPHLHFQLQRSPLIGAPTRELELYDLVTEAGEGPRLHRSMVPGEGVALRNLERNDDIARLFAVPLGARLRFAVTDGRGREREETVASRIDLFNNLYLESEERGTRLYYESQSRQFLVYDCLGARDSALYLLYVAAPRVPFEQPVGLHWDDVLSWRHFRHAWSGWLSDLADPFLPLEGHHLELEARRDAGALVVSGKGRVGRRALSTSARFEPGRGPAELRVSMGGDERVARLVGVEHGL